jgi:hypothetical protein
MNLAGEPASEIYVKSGIPPEQDTDRIEQRNDDEVKMTYCRTRLNAGLHARIKLGQSNDECPAACVKGLIPPPRSRFQRCQFYPAGFLCPMALPL